MCSLFSWDLPNKKTQAQNINNKMRSKRTKAAAVSKATSSPKEQEHETESNDRNTIQGVSISIMRLASFFNMPIAEAAQKLNISTHMLRVQCRKYGIVRWPYRTRSSCEQRPYCYDFSAGQLMTQHCGKKKCTTIVNEVQQNCDTRIQLQNQYSFEQTFEQQVETCLSNDTPQSFSFINSDSQLTVHTFCSNLPQFSNALIGRGNLLHEVNVHCDSDKKSDQQHVSLQHHVALPSFAELVASLPNISWTDIVVWLFKVFCSSYLENWQGLCHCSTMQQTLPCCNLYCTGTINSFFYFTLASKSWTIP